MVNRSSGVLMPFFKDSHIALSSSSDVLEICRPIFHALDIHTFRYLRVYLDESRICLSNNPNWIIHFHENKLYKEAWFDCKPIAEYSNGKTIWDAKEGAEGNRVGYEARHFFNMHHGLTITKKSPDSAYCEFFNFSTYKENSNINHLYESAEDFIQRFIFYFIDKAGPLIREASKNKIIIPDFPPKEIADNQEKLLLPERQRLNFDFFLDETEISRYWVKDSIYLTKKEVEIISLSSKGMSTKEIASSISSSSRTIECHIANAKNKLKCKNVTELICFFLNSSIINSFELRKEL